MNSKQNLLETIHWGNPEYMPTYLDSEALVGTPVKELFVHPYAESRKDCFGVEWLIETAGAIPDPSNVMFDDVEDWEEYGVNGGYVFFPFIITSKGNAFAVRDPRCPAIMDEYQKVKNCL